MRSASKRMAKALEREKRPVPPLVDRLLSSGKKSFYESSQGELRYFDLSTAAMQPAPEPPGIIILKSLKDRSKTVQTQLPAPA